MRKLTRDQIWEIVKPLRAKGRTNKEIALKLYRRGVMRANGGLWPETYVSDLVRECGGQMRRPKKRFTASQAVNEARSAIGEAPATQTATATVDCQPTEAFATFAQIADISISNLQASTKKHLVRQLVAQL